MDLACQALSVDPDHVAVVARLFVDPDSRSQGAGRALLEHAATQARQSGRLPILDVGRGLTRAIALYEHSGWQRLGEVTIEIRDGSRFQSFVYAGPVVS